MLRQDSRVPVVVGPAARAAPGDRVLSLDGGAPGHAPGCACCRPRDGIALALSRLFIERARDPGLDFTRVLVDVADADPAGAVARAIEGDVLARARYRFAGSV